MIMNSGSSGSGEGCVIALIVAFCLFSGCVSDSERMKDRDKILENMMVLRENIKHLQTEIELLKAKEKP